MSACNVNPPAATVNGVQISESSFQNQLNLLVGSSTVRCAIGMLTGEKTLPARGAGTDTVPTEDADAELSQLIDIKLYSQDLARLHTSVGSTYLGYARQTLPALFTPTSGSSPCGLTGTSMVSALPAWYVNQQVTLLAQEEQIISAVGHVNLGQAGIEAFYQENPNDFKYACLDALGTSTEAEATADVAKIKGGASFTSVAESDSMNAQLGSYGFTPDGTYPCEPYAYIGQEQPNWAGALDSVQVKIGAVAPPFQDSSSVDYGGSGAWVVIELVRNTTQALTSQIALEIQEHLYSENADVFASEQAKILSKASVTVDPEFGNWTGGLAQLKPPSVPKADYLLNRTADDATS